MNRGSEEGIGLVATAGEYHENGPATTEESCLLNVLSPLSNYCAMLCYKLHPQVKKETI